MLAFLVALLLEVPCKTGERDGVAVKVCPDGVVGVHGGVLDVDVPVDGGLLVVVVADVAAGLDGRVGLRGEDQAGEVLAGALDVDFAEVDGRGIGGHGGDGGARGARGARGASAAGGRECIAGRARGPCEGGT